MKIYIKRKKQKIKVRKIKKRVNLIFSKEIEEKRLMKLKIKALKAIILSSMIKMIIKVF